jgi:hypothetical protein
VRVFRKQGWRPRVLQIAWKDQNPLCLNGFWDLQELRARIGKIRSRLTKGERLIVCILRNQEWIENQSKTGEK